MDFDFTGIGGIFLLVLVVWAIVSIVNSRASTGGKVLWCLLVLIFPFIGFLLWLIFGPRARR